MRILSLFAGIAVIGVAGLVLVGRPGTPASQTLDGVHVQVTSIQVVPGAGEAKRLFLGIVVSSARDLDECLAFALDEPFAQRLFMVPSTRAGCLRPQAAASLRATISFDRLDDIDSVEPAHKLLWGMPGASCGLIVSLMGICAVDTAGTVNLTLPVSPVLPTFGPIGTFAPFPTYGMR